MKAIFHPGLLCLLLLGCTPDTPAGLPKAPERPSRLSVMSPLFRDVVIGDTFFVYGYNDGNHRHFFYGTPIDSAQILSFPAEAQSGYQSFKDLAACYQFPIDSNRIAFLARVPGEYLSSSIDLYVFDVRKDSVVQVIGLADVFGDAGEVMSYKSCIYRNKDRSLAIVTHWESSYSHSVDNENDTTVEHWNRYYLRDFSKHLGDTLSKDSAFISQRYPDVVKRLQQL